MASVCVTTVSPKGQVVIPDEIRRTLGIVGGEKFAVTGSGSVVIFKRISMPSAKELFKEVFKTGKAFAKEKNLSEEEVVKKIHKSRGVEYD